MKPGPYERVFLSARRRLRRSQNWTKGAFARIAAHDLPVEMTSRSATCFCISAALRLAILKQRGGLDAFSFIGEVSQMIDQKFGFKSLPRFNDAAATTHADILEFLDVAVLNCKLAGV